MAIIANMATYPGRRDQSVQAIRSIASQVDVINVVLNEYVFVPPELKVLPRTNFIFPPEDLKDVGKFLPRVDPEDDVFLCDDDIEYPADYVERMMRLRAGAESIDPILGLHGIIYSDYYEGKPRAGRLVEGFTREVKVARLVNQLGTGTIYCKGRQMPGFDYMQDSQRFVDVRFARHAKATGAALVCVPRGGSWLKQIAVDGSIYESFTETHPSHVVREIQDIAGHSHLDPRLASRVETLVVDAE